MRVRRGHHAVLDHAKQKPSRRRRRRRWQRLLLVVVALVIVVTVAASRWRTLEKTRPCDDAKKPLVRVFTFHKDEEYLLGDWLAYHCYVFGCENVVLIDHASTMPTVSKLISLYRTKGVAIVDFRGEFKDKANALSQAMRANSNAAEFLVPIDVDEFIVVDDGSKVSADREKILNAFASLDLTDRRKFKFNSRVADCPQQDDGASKRPALVDLFSKPKATSMAKTFFHARDFVLTDQGNHVGRVRRDNGTDQDVMLAPKRFDDFFKRTSLSLLHFSMPDFDTWYSKLFQRAAAYGFTMNTNCAAIRKGQRYCRSFQALNGGSSDRQEAQLEYTAVCNAIAAQQNQQYQSGHLRKPAENMDRLTALADFLLRKKSRDDLA